VIGAALFVLLHESLVGGKGLVPVDAIFGYPPWSTTAVVEPSNYLLVDQYLDPRAVAAVFPTIRSCRAGSHSGIRT
jgi:hypothetical protein